MPKTAAHWNSRITNGLCMLTVGIVLLMVSAACNTNSTNDPTHLGSPSPSKAGATEETKAQELTDPTPAIEATGKPTPISEHATGPHPRDQATPGYRPKLGDLFDNEETIFPAPPDRDYYRLAQQLIPGTDNVDRVVSRDSPFLKEGHRKTFKLVDLDSKVLYESEFELRLVTPRAYWFVEDGVKASQDDIEKSASEFEDNIYPKVTGVFGQEWTPGVDGDPHLYIINAHLRGVGGYYSAADEYPATIRPVSNEIEAIYTNAKYLPIGSDIFSQVLAHELQHAIHWNHDLSEETWVNEGLSELAVAIAGYPEISILEFRLAGPASLTIWPADDVGGAENYGAASLFMNYLTAHYGDRDDLRPLLTEQADGIPGIDAYLEASGQGVRFIEIFRDWAIANLLDEDNGPYGYPDTDIRFPVYSNLKSEQDLALTTPQYANEYVRLEQLSVPATLSFVGEVTVPLLPVDIDEGCWWSNKGDVIDSTLTTALDLRTAVSPALNFEVWHSIEENWDFAYLEVSVDGGKTWTILETPLTSDEDPLDVSFGPGYTGTTDDWEPESISLDRWAGQEILVRFQYITDAAIHDHGLCLREIQVIDEGGGAELATEWTPSGFYWTNNLVPQNFILQVVYEGKDGLPNRVIRLELDEQNHVVHILEPDPDAKRVIAVIQPVASATRLPSSYSLELDPAK